MSPSTPDLAVIIGASRGLGLGLAREYLRRGWRVIGTVREAGGRARLEALAGEAGGRLEIEAVDINEPDQVAALRRRLEGRAIDLLFVNAGIANDPGETVGQMTTEAFIHLMTTNALSPLRVVEALGGLVKPDGVIAAMSSGLGSVAGNTSGGWEVYRASKASLNTLLRSYVVRAGGGRAVLAVAPGWVRTDMGGPNATLDVETSVRGIADAIAARRGKAGAAFIDHQGHTVAW